MTDYAEKWTGYRRVLRLTILSFIGCFAFGVLIGLGLNEKRQPVVFAAAGSVDALCFLSLCYNGLRLSWFRARGAASISFVVRSRIASAMELRVAVTVGWRYSKP